MDILKISESELCDLIIAKHRKARDSLEREVDLLQKATLLYEKHDQLKHRAQMCEEECAAEDKVNKYLEKEKKVSEELSRVRNSLKTRAGNLTNIEVQKKTATLKQSIEEQDNALSYWRSTKQKLVKEAPKEVKEKKQPKKEKAKKPAKKKETKSKKKSPAKKKKEKKK
jgi:hypothetical protein